MTGKLSRCILYLFATIAGLGQAGSAGAQTTGASFFDDFDTFSRSRWYVSDGWSNGAYQNCTWSKNQVSIADGIVTLGFEKKRYKDRDYSCAEIQTTQRFGYGVFEARMKTDKGSGLNAAFFSYTNDPHDEIDFEVLTKDTSKVSLNTYVSGEPKHGAVVDVPGGTTQFNDYAFVWEEGRMRWYVNGNLVHEATGTDLPTNPQKIFFSLWGTDTLSDWMGVFADPGGRKTLQVDWIAYTAPGEPCQFPESVACSLR